MGTLTSDGLREKVTKAFIRNNLLILNSVRGDRSCLSALETETIEYFFYCLNGAHILAN